MQPNLRYRRRTAINWRKKNRRDWQSTGKQSKENHEMTKESTGVTSRKKFLECPHIGPQLDYAT